MDLFDLTGRRALITGASRGIGHALAKGLAAAGAEVVLNGRNEAALEEAAAAIPGARTLAFDVADRAAVSAAVTLFEEEVGAIDILVNNAGVQHRAPLEAFPPEEFARLMEINVTGVFNVSQCVAPHMLARGRGRIINVASVNSMLARPTIAPYTATKGAVANLTKGMATDWGRRGLNCNAIAPGYFETELNRALRDDPEFHGWLQGRVPQGRWGQVDELAGACIFLASDAASYVNGLTLYVDGGLTASV
ncbi:glucose 1-dehydrogenase [Pseudoroseicyclus tamaricis]|uniref:Glucose 1-dehydrogenase n=1 Tax=Pseudoroseicyclus tamaricis TaxID=2705421 RepID=A0A6B2K3K4_9RHOB|nr:glucose 1-dehydrogenase [Pseudoroseicyclus tamaricis]NDV02382.1 glucose 1-dehydrogenase [Pseudoroseicyclus tamaricis]